MYRIKTLDEFIESGELQYNSTNIPRNWTFDMNKYFGHALSKKSSKLISEGLVVLFHNYCIHPYHCIKINNELNYEVY